MRKIKYKKGRKLQPYNLEYTGIHKRTDSEIQLFVYDDANLSEYVDFNVADLKRSIDVKKTNWLPAPLIKNQCIQYFYSAEFNFRSNS